MEHPLRTYRQQRGISLDKLAVTAGLSKASLSRIETGEQKTTQVTIEKLCQATEGFLSPNDFISIPATEDAV